MRSEGESRTPRFVARRSPVTCRGSAGGALKRAVILFDVDGTLVDPETGVASSVLAATQALGLPPPSAQVLRRLIGPPLQDGFAEVLGLSPAQVEAAVSVFRQSYSRRGLYDYRI